MERRERRHRKAYATLRDYFAQSGALQSDTAADLGISEAHLSNIISGRKRPSIQVALALTKLTNVPIESFANLNA